MQRARAVYFVSAGRDVGPCFHCKGAGKESFQDLAGEPRQGARCKSLKNKRFLIQIILWCHCGRVDRVAPPMLD